MSIYSTFQHRGNDGYTLWERVKDWFESGGFILVGLAVLLPLIFWLISVGAEAEKKERDAWMAECRQDRKNYECVAMWRAGTRRDTTVVVPVAVGR